MIDTRLLKNEERAIFTLRALYNKYGYLPFKMSKFEEYDIYVRNKDFLVSDSVITFNDTNGKLLALKPDVTLSIIKNTTDKAGCKDKVYYNENVYRVSPKTHQFKEIMQTGLECIGDIDEYDVFEAVYLASKSLDTVSPDFVLDISHMGIISAILDEACDSLCFKKEALRLIAERNIHETEALCREFGIDEESKNAICSFVNMYGTVDAVLPELDKLCVSERAKKELGDLRSLCALISKTEYKNNIHIDFSVLNDMSYYNGIVFKGFLKGIPEGVLSGGRYDKLIERMGRKSGAIGFALYLDLLEELNTEKRLYDVDTLIIYDDTVGADKIADTVAELTKNGLRVSCQKAIPEKLRYKEKVNLCKEGR
ncbi:MAG: ATP phosphoribosyltransferase regulatory subunit [Clostridia bacterium]|nr:ATP phosphoribosyltransferase regulatory subunit [Clostridia bacterium]